MGWKGTLRSLAAAARAAERDSQRRQKLALKDQMVSDAADAVDAWEQYVEELVSIHTDLLEPLDWHSIAVKPKPREPVFRRAHRDAASRSIENFKPSFFHIFQGGSGKKRKQLEDALAHASGRDEADHQRAKAQYAQAIADWEADTQLAHRLAQGDAEAIREVIEEFQSFSDQDLVGTSVTLAISDGFVHVKPVVHSDEIVPSFRRKQLASGKLSETKMPIGQFNELYQDYVASVALKIAGDLLRILPLDEIYVTCMAKMLNTQTGHQELTPILSIQFVRETMTCLNLSNLDPSDSLSNFNHAMNFKKTKGFAPITPLRPVD